MLKGDLLPQPDPDRPARDHPHRAARALRHFLRRLLPARERRLGRGRRFRPRRDGGARSAPSSAPGAAQGGAGGDPDRAGPSPPRGTETRVVRRAGRPGAGQPDLGAAAGPAPRHQGEPDAAAGRTSSACAILNRRLERIANARVAALHRRARAGAASSAERVELVQVMRRRPARRMARRRSQRSSRSSAAPSAHGFTQAELDREISERRTALTAAAAAAATRPAPALAEAAGRRRRMTTRSITTPADNLALFEEAVRGLTAARVGEAARAPVRRQGPLVYMTSPTPVEGGEQALARRLRSASRASAVAAPEARADKAWPYQSFGTPGTVAERRELADLGVTCVRFANGVRLTVKPTEFARTTKSMVNAALRRRPHVDLPRDRPSARLGLLGAFPQGGLGKLRPVRRSRQVLVRAPSTARDRQLDDDAFGLRGATRPADFARQMQILAAFATDPGWRPTGWDRGEARHRRIHAQFRSTPGGVVRPRFRRPAPHRRPALGTSRPRRRWRRAASPT